MARQASTRSGSTITTRPLLSSRRTSPARSAANGWYTSDVVGAVERRRSGLRARRSSRARVARQSTDVASNVFSCFASSGGGATTSEVVVKRDATAAVDQHRAAASRELTCKDRSVVIDFSCSDATSGVSSCTANQAGYLNTSTSGTFAFVVTAVDHAGNTSQASVSYSVHGKVDTWLSLSSSPSPSKPNQDVTLTATLSGLSAWRRCPDWRGRAPRQWRASSGPLRS